jgi:drug/metabolite transporter (DMT)-like permease
MLLFFWRRHGAGVFRSNRPGLQLTRSAWLFLSSTCWISAVAVALVTTASAINFTAPIFVGILSIPILGERVGIHRWSAVLVGFVGALVVIRPGSGGMHAEVALLLVAAFLFSLYQIHTRMAAATDTEATSSIYTVLVVLVVSGMLLSWNYVSADSGDTLVCFLSDRIIGRHPALFRGEGLYIRSCFGDLAIFLLRVDRRYSARIFVFGGLPQSSTWLGAGIIVCSGLYIAH